jgi:hypothetical protein
MVLNGNEIEEDRYVFTIKRPTANVQILGHEEQAKEQLGS